MSAASSAGGAYAGPPRRLTSFVGRQRDVAEVAALVAGHRMVTITGPGGIGKTSLAGRVLDRHDHSSATVDLSTIHDDDEVAALVARVLRVAEQTTRPPLERIVRHVGDRELLLYLDNCEHVRAGVRDLVGPLLASCPRLAVLATSTVRLDVPGEHLYDLPPLDVPGPGDSLEELRDSSSVRLLVDRARQLVPSFDVTPANAGAVRRLAELLDGIPLAIELAALRLRVLSVEELVERLSDRFAVLTGGGDRTPERHRSLRAMVEWSYERCSPQERTVWARLSVLPDTFRLAMAEAVCGFGEIAPEAVLDLLSGLVERSVVIVDRVGDRVHYRQLSTMRDFGAALLRQRGERDSAMANLLGFCLDRSREMGAQWCGPHQAEFLAVWRHEHATLLVAFDWALEHPDTADAAAELLVLLRYHWIAGGQLSDGRRWLDRMLGHQQLSRQRRGEVLAVASWVALIQGDRAAAARYLDEAGVIAVAEDDAVLLAYVRSYAALLALFEGRLEDAVTGYQGCIDVLLASGHQAGAQTAMFQLAMAQTYLGKHAEALATCAREKAIGEPRGELWDRAYAEWVSAVCHWHEGRLDQVEASAREALRIQESFEDGICTALVLLVVAWVRARQGCPGEASRAAAAADVVWQLLGTTVEAFGPDFAAESARWVPTAGLGAEDTRPQTKAEAVACGLDILAHGGDPESAGQPALPELTPRENEVVPYLVEGLSNRAIAERLVVSTRTVEGHVQRILAKLGLASRAEVPGWYARRRTT